MLNNTIRRGLLIILSSPSGAGKSTLARRLMNWDKSLLFSVSSTTRKIRKGEEHGKDYFFIGDSKFQQQVSDGDMLEHAHVFGKFYGSPREPVELAISNGQDVLFDIDWQGAQQISNSALQKNVLSIFILPPSISELERRLEGRGQDTAEVIANRMQKCLDEISHWSGYDYVLINDDLDATEQKLISILSTERLRRSQQPGLVGHVRSLQSEFKEKNDL